MTSQYLPTNLTKERAAMNIKKVEMRQSRLNRVQARAEAYKKLLVSKGMDGATLERNPMMRHLLAEVRKVKLSVETLKWEPPKAAPAEEKAEKPAKEAAAPKAPKPPKEKKAPKGEQAPAS
jgi:hypothetical protein